MIKDQFIKFKNPRQANRAGLSFEIFDPQSNQARFDSGSIFYPYQFTSVLDHNEQLM
jgi:hypothetical protein